MKPLHPGFWSSKVHPHLLCRAEVQKELRIRSHKSAYEKQPPVAQQVPEPWTSHKVHWYVCPLFCTLLQVSHSAVLPLLYFLCWVLFQKSCCSFSEEQLCIRLEKSQRATVTPGMLLPDNTFDNMNRESYCDKRGRLDY